LPEHHRKDIQGHRRIANPGCYATGAQAAIWPFLNLLEGSPHIFGVSGYSGAGTTPSEKNDPKVLKDNLLPYALSGHTHEKEVSHHLGTKVCFMPHVASFFRGISLTVSMRLKEKTTLKEVQGILDRAYENEELIKIQKAIPLVRDNVEQPYVALGGITLSEDGQDLVVVATLDNLLKGAATQAVQNMNIAMGWEELSGIKS